MPIQVDRPIQILSQEQFASIAFDVVGQAFVIHNELGRFFDEQVYQNALLGHFGARADTEVLIHVSHNDFRKSYRIDLLIDGGAIFELKAVQRLHEQHRQQLIHYLMLTGLDVHLYEEAVTHRFGGPERVERKVEVVRDGQVIGRQRTCLLDPATAFKITTLRKDLAAYESHLRRFLDHTGLERFLWANITLGEVSFRDVRKEN